MLGAMNLFLLFLVVASLFLNGDAVIRGREPRCPKPPADGWPDPTGCNFGVARDICGKPSCAMGPGEVCKYKRFRGSNCGEGTFCHCSKCMGCSLYTYTCFETTCVYPMHTRR